MHLAACPSVQVFLGGSGAACTRVSGQQFLGEGPAVLSAGDQVNCGGQAFEESLTRGDLVLDSDGRADQSLSDRG